MLQNIILLTPQPQQHRAIGALLKSHNPALTFASAVTLQDLAAINPILLPQSRLIAFTSGTIVPPQILHALGYGAYNLHPGPPEYSGWAPAHVAMYERARVFGATAHAMTERVDEGAIVGVERFIVPNGIAVRELEQIAYIRLAYLLWRLSKDLATRTEPLPVLPIEWSRRKSTRRGYAAMCDIPTNISKDELTRRMNAFHDDFRGMVPVVTLHGFEFRAVAPSQTASKNAETTPIPVGNRNDLRKRAAG